MNRYEERMMRQVKGMFTVMGIVVVLLILGEIFPGFKSICNAPGMGVVFAGMFIGIIAAFGGFRL